MKTSRAKLFHDGGTQAVRLPKECRFSPKAEVIVRREGRRVIIEPKDEWSAKFRACLGAWTGAFLAPNNDKLEMYEIPSLNGRLHARHRYGELRATRAWACRS